MKSDNVYLVMIDLICLMSACLVLVLYCFLSGEITWWSPLWVKELQADQFEVYNIPPSPPWPTLSSVPGGGGVSGNLSLSWVGCGVVTKTVRSF